MDPEDRERERPRSDRREAGEHVEHAEHPEEDGDDLLPEHPFFSGASTRLGRLSVALSAVLLGLLLLMNLFFYIGVMGRDAQRWLVWALWGPVALLGAATFLAGIAALWRGEERSRLVYLASSVGATLAVLGAVQLVG
ncbi:MAG: hypothetical protein IBX62_07935 [Coriobacteriia bacterium]|nr:hypothetical protein [Coriobacteriia bacterium]